jgi:hypothetical protein
MLPEEIEAVLDVYLPDSFQKGLLRTVFVGHAAGYDMSFSQMAPTEARNVVGFNRRGKLEGGLRDLVGRFPTFEATVVAGEGNAWFHTEVRSGPIVLTASSVQSPCDLAYKAEFRRGLAERTQLSFFDEDEEAAPPVKSLYALLLHSPSRWQSRDERQKYSKLPGSAYLAFPHRDLESYAYGINLFDKFPEVVQEYMPNEWDAEARVRYIGRARKLGTA